MGGVCRLFVQASRLFVQICSYFVLRHPLHKPSPFGDKAIIQKLMVHGGGLTGKITSLLAQAAELAIRKKTESISLDLLIDAAAAGIFKLPAEQEIDDAPA